MGTLILQDGSVFKGKTFGALGGYEGEIVFNTSPFGYQKILSDPSYFKQIVVFANPEMGNCAINDADFESENTDLVGVVIKNYCNSASHYRSRESLADFLRKKGVVGLCDIDTRTLVKKITQVGTMNAFITSNNVNDEFIKEKLAQIQSFKFPSDTLAQVSTANRYILNPQGKINAAIIDYGVKKSYLNALIKRNCKLTVYPSEVNSKEILDNNFDALFLSNGPGNPNEYVFQVSQIKNLMGKLPIFGVGLGFNILALAAGAAVDKMKFGHRSSSIGVINLENNKIYMTCQNHQWTIDSDNLTNIMRPTYKNLDDNTIEGFEISSLAIYAVQFEPYANPGSEDCGFIFDEWMNIIKKDIEKINGVKNER